MALRRSRRPRFTFAFGRRAAWTAFFILVPAAVAWAGERTWTGNTNTNWLVAGNWNPASVPVASDRATIPAVVASNRMPTIFAASPAPAAIGALRVFGTLTIEAGRTLSIDGITSPISPAIIDGTGTVTGAGQLNVTDGANNGTIIGQSITLGNLSLNSPIGRNFVVSSNATVTFNGNVTMNASEIRLGTPTGAASTIDINGNLFIGTNAELFLQAPNSILRVSGNWTQTGRFTSGTNSTVFLDGAGAQTIDIETNQAARCQFENLTIANAGTVTYLENSALSPGFIVLDNLTVTGGALVVQDNSVVGDTVGDVFGIGSGATATFTQQFDPDCTISFNIDAGADDGVLVLQGATLPPDDLSDFGFGLIPGQGTVRIQTTANGTLHLSDGGPFSFYNLEIDTNAGSGQIGTDVITAGAAFNVLNDLILTEGQLQIGAFTVDINGDIDSSAGTSSQLDFTSGSTIVQVAGNVDLDTFSQVSTGTGGPFGLLHLDGTAAQTYQIRATSGSQFHDLDALRISNPAGVTVLNNPNGFFTVNGTLTLDAGCSLTVQDQYDADGPLVFSPGGGNTLRLEGTLSDDASELGSSFAPGTGTVIYAGTALSQTVFTRINATTPISYYNLTIDNTGAGVATQEAGAVLDVNGSFTIFDADAAFTAAPGDMTVAVDFICNGTFNNDGRMVTMDGTGIIGGNSPDLDFFDLRVSGTTTDVVTAARSFATEDEFIVVQGTLTTSGVATPITISARLGLSAGDGTGGTGTALLELIGPVTLAVQPGQSIAVDAVDGRIVSRASGSDVPTITRIGGSGAFDTAFNGIVDLYGLNFSYGDAEGLEITATARIDNLRRVRFTGIDPNSGSRHLTIIQAQLDGDYPGNFFDALAAGTYNVWIVDATPGSTPVRARFEDRGDAPPGQGGGGPGAGEAGDADDDPNQNGVLEGGETTAAHGGAIVQWVYTANIDMSGAIQGFPMPAFDWNTFVTYSTYVIMRNSSGGADSIYVLDINGDLRNYSFTLPSGDIIGPLFWDTEGADRVVYFGTSLGQVYKLIDTGAGLVAPSGDWSSPFTDGTLTEVTSPIISDQTNIYFGGADGAVNGIYKVQISNKTLPQAAVSTVGLRVTTAPSWADSLTTRYLFMGSLTSGGVSNIYRVNLTNWSLDATVARGSDIVAPTFVPGSYLYVGEIAGWMNGLPALGTAAEFQTPRPGFPFRDTVSPIRGGATIEWPENRLHFGNDAGELYSLKPDAYAGAWSPGVNYSRFATGAGPIRTMPLAAYGVVYVPNAAGSLLMIDANDGTGPTLVITYALGSLPLGDVSREPETFRLYVGTAGGRLYSIDAIADPTPAAP